MRQSCRHTNLKVCLARDSTAYLHQWLVGDLHYLARPSFGEAERAAIERSGRVDARSTNAENSDGCCTGCRRDSFSPFDDRCVAEDVEFRDLSSVFMTVGDAVTRSVLLWQPSEL